MPRSPPTGLRPLPTHRVPPDRRSRRAAMTGCSGWGQRNPRAHSPRMGSYADHEVPVIVRGEGCYVYDEHGKRYLDGLSALYCVNVGHGRAELAEAASTQAGELGLYSASG